MSSVMFFDVKIWSLGTDQVNVSEMPLRLLWLGLQKSWRVWFSFAVFGCPVGPRWSRAWPQLRVRSNWTGRKPAGLDVLPRYPLHLELPHYFPLWTIFPLCPRIEFQVNTEDDVSVSSLTSPFCWFLYTPFSFCSLFYFSVFSFDSSLSARAGSQGMLREKDCFFWPGASTGVGGATSSQGLISFSPPLMFPEPSLLKAKTTFDVLLH